MTPQSFSYGTIGNNNMIYLPPYGLNQSLNYMLKIDPYTFTVSKISLNVTDCFEKWTTGVVLDNKIYFLPYNEQYVLVLDTDNDSIEYISMPLKGKGKYNNAHLYKDKIIALPYGIEEPYNFACIIDTKTNIVTLQEIELPINDQKKWHTTQIIQNKIYGVPRGENWNKPYFPYIIEFNCDDYSYKLTDMSHLWIGIDQQQLSNKKYTTLAKYNDNLYAPPYSENPNFDIMLKYVNGNWEYEHTNLIKTSRKYYSHTVANNGKIYFPPAGHEEDWSELLVIDGKSGNWYTKELNIGKESKKYFAGCENSKGKLYFIPRGGCVCMPEESWKEFGDLVEVLVIDTNDDTHYTIDISEYFTDNTTIEKYNHCVLIDDKIFAFPYGESEEFQTLLVFDTTTEKVIKTIDLNEI